MLQDNIACPLSTIETSHRFHASQFSWETWGVSYVYLKLQKNMSQVWQKCEKNQGNQNVPIFSLLHTSTFSCDRSDWRSANSGVTVSTHRLTCQSDHMQPQSCHVFCAFLVHISRLHACLNRVWWYFFSVHMLRFFAITWFSEVRNIVLSAA